jgi:hypothetical protein
MPAGIILQFPSGLTETEYDAVNVKLGWNPKTGEGDRPAGLQSHTAGLSDDGWVVTEVWDSREAQGAFMESRLGASLEGMPHPKITWFDVVASEHIH